MTLEEKLENLSLAVIEDAALQSEALIQEYQKNMEHTLKTYEEELIQHNQEEYEYQYAKLEHEKNKALSQAILESRMLISKKKEELSKKLFDLITLKLLNYKKTKEYEDYLLKLIDTAINFSKGHEITLYIDPSDASLKNSLEQKSGKTITISDENFLGGIRAVIIDKNILIDESFTTKISEEKERNNGGFTLC